MQVSFTGNKLSLFFISEDKTKFEYRHDVNFLGICPETTCNDNGTGEAKRLIFEVVKHHNSRDIKLHLLKHALEINHQHVSEKDFKITGNGFRGTKQEKKVVEALLIREIKPTLTIQDQLVPLQLFS